MQFNACVPGLLQRETYVPFGHFLQPSLLTKAKESEKYPPAKLNINRNEKILIT